MYQSREDRDISELEEKIANTGRQIEMLRQRKRERLAAAGAGVDTVPGMSDYGGMQSMGPGGGMMGPQGMRSMGPGGGGMNMQTRGMPGMSYGRGSGTIKERLGARGHQVANFPQRAPPQPWTSGGPPDGFKRTQFPGFGQRAQTQNVTCGGPVEEFKRKFAGFAQKAQTPPQPRGVGGFQRPFGGLRQVAPPPEKASRVHHDLPAELVLTEITEEGPRAKVPNVNNNRVEVRSEKKKEVEEEEEVEDLDRYENENDLDFF